MKEKKNKKKKDGRFQQWVPTSVEIFKQEKIHTLHTTPKSVTTPQNVYQIRRGKEIQMKKKKKR